MATLHILIDRPVHLHRIVAADIHQQQDYAILNKHIEERESESKKLKFFRILTQRSLLLFSRVEAARTDLVFRFAIGVSDARKGGETVHLGKVPVGVEFRQLHSIEIYNFNIENK